MAVVGSAYELPDSPEGSTTNDKISITKKYLVQVNSYADGPETVKRAVGLPRPFQIYSTSNETNPLCRVREISAKRHEPNSLYWQVTVKYETPDKGEEEDEEENENPLVELPEISTSFIQHQEPVTGTLDSVNGSSTDGFLDASLRNSAGQIYDPPPQKDASRMVLTISRNEDLETPHPALAVQYQDAVNSDEFWGHQPGQVKVTGIEVRKEQKQLEEEGIYFQYLKTTYVFEFRDTWDIFLLDKGTVAKETTGGAACPSTEVTCNPVAFLTDDGHPYEGLLNGFGGKLANGAAVVFNGPYEIYKRKPFDALNLPQSFAGAKAKGKT